MSVAIEFPGAAVTATGDGSTLANTYTVTLAAPGAGLLNCIDACMLSLQVPAATAQLWSVVLGGAAGGIDPLNLALVTVLPNISPQFYPIVWGPTGWPAKATATALSVTINNLSGGNFSVGSRVTLFGHTIPI